MAYLERTQAGNKIGYKNGEGKMVIPPIYDDGGMFSLPGADLNTHYCVVMKGGRCGVLDKNGNIVLPLVYQESVHLFDDLFAVRKYSEDNSNTWRYGVVNSKQETIIPFDYQFICAEGHFIRCCTTAQLKRKYYMDTTGRIYDYSLLDDGEWYNSEGEKIYVGKGIKSECGLLVIEIADHKGLIDQNGKCIIEANYAAIRCVSSDRYVVKETDDKGGLLGILGPYSKTIIPFKFNFISDDNDSFFLCSISGVDNQWHSKLIKHTDIKDPIWYNHNGSFVFSGYGEVLNDQALGVKQNGRWGVYNQKGEKVVNFLYDEIISVQGFLVVGKDKRIGVLSSEGQIVINCAYQSIECVKIDGEKYGGLFSTETYGSYNKDNVFCTDTPDKNLLFRRKVSYTIVNNLSTPALISSGISSFDWNKVFILSNPDYSELFTISDGICSSSRFERIFHLTENCFAVQSKSKWGVFQSDVNEVIIPCEYDTISFQGGQSVLLRKDGLWGAKSVDINLRGTLVEISIPTQYLDIKILDEKEFWFGVKLTHEQTDDIDLPFPSTRREGYIIINRSGNQKESSIDRIETDSQFEWFRQDRILSSINGKWGFVTTAMYCSIPFIYDRVEPRKDENFDVQIAGRWGVLNLEGMEIVAVKYLERIPECIKYSIVQDFYSHSYGLLGEDGREIIPTIHDHLILRDNLVYFGQGGYEEENASVFANVAWAKWGCMDLAGNLLIPPKYDCYKVQGTYILAGRDGCFCGDSDSDYRDRYTGVYDLYTVAGIWVFGGFNVFEESENHFFFMLNGEWESYTVVDEPWNHIHIENVHLDHSHARWLVVDKNLLSVLPGKDNKRVQLHRFFKAIIEKKEENGRITYYYNLDVEILVEEKPFLTTNYLLTKGIGASQAVRLMDGKTTRRYDSIQVFSDDIFFVRKDEFVGIITFTNDVILPIEYLAFTRPVGGYFFAVKEAEDGMCSVVLFKLEENKLASWRAIERKERYVVIDEMLHGMYIISLIPGKEVLKEIGVFRPTVFDESFAKQIDAGRHGKYYRKYDINYWFSGLYSLEESTENYSGENAPDKDCLKDSWDAMTDGMYGDMPMPDGFDGDYSFLGR